MTRNHVVLAAILACLSCHTQGETMADWPFDQGPNVATITTRQVVHGGLPILSVVHYADDHSWAFTCGTTDNPDDAMLISMQQALELDPTLVMIADLPPGWSAWRSSVDSAWVRTRDE